MSVNTDYRYVTGDVDKILIDGRVMPLRDEDKKVLRGEDVVYLYNEYARRRTVFSDYAPVLEFTNKVSADQLGKIDYAQFEISPFPSVEWIGSWPEEGEYGSRDRWPTSVLYEPSFGTTNTGDSLRSSDMEAAFEKLKEYRFVSFMFDPGSPDSLSADVLVNNAGETVPVGGNRSFHVWVSSRYGYAEGSDEPVEKGLSYWWTKPVNLQLVKPLSMCRRVEVWATAHELVEYRRDDGTAGWDIVERPYRWKIMDYSPNTDQIVVPKDFIKLQMSQHASAMGFRIPSYAPAERGHSMSYLFELSGLTCYIVCELDDTHKWWV